MPVNCLLMFDPADVDSHVVGLAETGVVKGGAVGGVAVGGTEDCIRILTSPSLPS